MRSIDNWYRADAISFSDAIRAAYFRLGTVIGNAEPAHESSNPSRERIIRVGEAVICALLVGDLCAHYFDDGKTTDIPGWAWEPVRRGDIVWGTNRLRLDGLLPDDWNRWSGSVVYVGRDEFARWLDRVAWNQFTTAADRPPAHDTDHRPRSITHRLPTDTPFITLAEALTWVAFGIALDSDRLGRALDYQSLDAADSFRKLSTAINQVCARCSDGSVEFRGKHQLSHKQNVAAIAVDVIESIRLHSYARFNISHDGLDFGSGISGYTPDDNRLSLSDYPRDCYWRVIVNRAQFMAAFPPTVATEQPALATVPNNSNEPKAPRKRPGPAPDSDWPEVIARVTTECIAAGYRRTLKRGDKAAIAQLLLSAMGEKDKHFSDDSAARHAQKVIDALPDN